MRLVAGKLFDRLLKPVCFLLTEANTSPLEDSRFRSEILNLCSQGVWLRNYTLIISLRLGEVWGDLLYVLFLVFTNFQVVTVVIASEELAWIFSLLDDPRNFFETL